MCSPYREGLFWVVDGLHSALNHVLVCMRPGGAVGSVPKHGTEFWEFIGARLDGSVTVGAACVEIMIKMYA